MRRKTCIYAEKELLHNEIQFRAKDVILYSKKSTSHHYVVDTRTKQFQVLLRAMRAVEISIHIVSRQVTSLESRRGLPSHFLLSFALVKVFTALQKQEGQQYREIVKIFKIKILRNTK